MRYYLRADHQTDYDEVTKEEYIRAERNAGFKPKFAFDDSKYNTVIATAGFYGGGVSGKVEYEEKDYVKR